MSSQHSKSADNSSDAGHNNYAKFKYTRNLDTFDALPSPFKTYRVQKLSQARRKKTPCSPVQLMMHFNDVNMEQSNQMDTQLGDLRKRAIAIKESTDSNRSDRLQALSDRYAALLQDIDKLEVTLGTLLTPVKICESEQLRISGDIKKTQVQAQNLMHDMNGHMTTFTEVKDRIQVISAGNSSDFSWLGWMVLGFTLNTAATLLSWIMSIVRWMKLLVSRPKQD